MTSIITSEGTRNVYNLEKVQTTCKRGTKVTLYYSSPMNFRYTTPSYDKTLGRANYCSFIIPDNNLDLIDIAVNSGDGITCDIMQRWSNVTIYPYLGT